MDFDVLSYCIGCLQDEGDVGGMGVGGRGIGDREREREAEERG